MQGITPISNVGFSDVVAFSVIFKKKEKTLGNLFKVKLVSLREDLSVKVKFCAVTSN